MIVIDFGHLSMRGIFAAKNDIIPNPKFAAHVALNMTLNVCDAFGASRENPVFIAVDSKPSWRHHYYTANCVKFPEYIDTKKMAELETEDTIWHTYKGNREKDPDIPWEAVRECLDVTLATLKQHSDLHVLEVPLAEADDIIAVLAKKCVEEKEECFLISGDKDFKQLQDDTYIHIYDPIKKIFVPKIDVTQFLRHHILIGDKSDNIKACRPKLGDKTAEKILPVILETLKLDPEMRKRYQFNQKLIDLDMIPEDIVASIREEIKKPYLNYNAMALIKFCRENQLFAIGERIMLMQLQKSKRTTKLNSVFAKERESARFDEESLAAFFED